jgi:hypothetical protein
MLNPKSEIDLRSIVQDEYFPKIKFDSTIEDGKIDFIVRPIGIFDDPLLWAESKLHPTDKYKMLAQLILTANKYKSDYPPKFLGVFDSEKFGFIEYGNIIDLFRINDFNWTQTPSLVDDKTINTVRNNIDDSKFLVFNYDNELKEFISENFNFSNEVRLKLITDGNFISIYDLWLKEVSHFLNIDSTAKALKDENINLADFYIADLLSENNESIVELKVNIETDKKNEVIYKIDFKGTNLTVRFKDSGKHHAAFWNKYKRPPAEQFHNIIIQRRDLLAATELRQRKGAFFTRWNYRSNIYAIHLEKTLKMNIIFGIVVVERAIWRLV